MSKSFIKVGDEVIVSIPINDRVIHKPVAKYHGKAMTVTKVIQVPQHGTALYELEGAVGKCDKPFTFVRSWLVKL